MEIYDHSEHYSQTDDNSEYRRRNSFQIKSKSIVQRGDIMRASVLKDPTITPEEQYMLNIRAIKKDTLHTIMLQQLYALNYVWIRFEYFVREKAPELYGTDEYYQLFEDYGSEEARRLIKALDFPRHEIKDIIRYLEYSHWAIFEHIETTELPPNGFRMRTLDCSAQNAAKRWGLPYYDCRAGGLWIRTGFFKGINPRARVRRIFTPAEDRPEGTYSAVSCEWQIWLE
jgi:hypothetical protein